MENCKYQLLVREVNPCYFKQKEIVSSSLEGMKFFKKVFSPEELTVREKLFVAALNNANEVIAYTEISSGGTAQTTCDLRHVFSFLVLNLASAVMICHNHPSGKIKPSQSDFQMTEKIKNACDIFAILFLDSLIITETEDYYSFADNIF